MHQSKPVFSIELLTIQSEHLHHWDAPDPSGGSAAHMYQIFTTGVLTSLGVQAWPCSVRSQREAQALEQTLNFSSSFLF